MQRTPLDVQSQAIGLTLTIPLVADKATVSITPSMAAIWPAAGFVDTEIGCFLKPEVAASVVRAFEEAARVGREAIEENRADPVRLMSEAFEGAQMALPSNVLPFVRRKPAKGPGGRA